MFEETTNFDTLDDLREWVPATVLETMRDHRQHGYRTFIYMNDDDPEDVFTLGVYPYEAWSSLTPIDTLLQAFTHQKPPADGTLLCITITRAETLTAFPLEPDTVYYTHLLWNDVTHEGTFFNLETERIETIVATDLQACLAAIFIEEP